jgi:hypothetical protein
MGYIDLKAVAQELSQLEQGWGGSPTIIGSPQGKSSTLSREQIFEIVRKLKKRQVVQKKKHHYKVMFFDMCL